MDPLNYQMGVFRGGEFIPCDEDNYVDLEHHKILECWLTDYHSDRVRLVFHLSQIE
ncbi:hypothetical protein IWW57_000177 [Coemansia sp. S610]|nr:hypothetical protein IWW57_000177 [Coemansia sp. S610]